MKTLTFVLLLGLLLAALACAAPVPTRFPRHARSHGDAGHPGHGYGPAGRPTHGHPLPDLDALAHRHAAANPHALSHAHHRADGHALSYQHAVPHAHGLAHLHPLSHAYAGHPVPSRYANAGADARAFG